MMVRGIIKKKFLEIQNLKLKEEGGGVENPGGNYFFIRRLSTRGLGSSYKLFFFFFFFPVSSALCLDECCPLCKPRLAFYKVNH